MVVTGGDTREHETLKRRSLPVLPEGVAIHEVGTTATYELRPVGGDGIQMLVLPGGSQGLFTALGRRVRTGYDLGQHDGPVGHSAPGVRRRNEPLPTPSLPIP